MVLFPKPWLLVTSSTSKTFISRSSRLEVFRKKGVLRNFAKFTGKHQCKSPFFNRVAGPRSAPLLKKRLWYRCFPVNFVEFLRRLFLQNTSRRLVLTFPKTARLSQNVTSLLTQCLLVTQKFCYSQLGSKLHVLKL